jgi:hypothetical protein
VDTEEGIMETVKVDIQKLQLLNDRINQTIDALAQLRQTVHAYTPMTGLQHSVGSVPFAQGFGQTFGQGFGIGYGQSAQSMFSPVGLQHAMSPYASAQGLPYGYLGQSNPFAQTNPFAQSNPYAQSNPFVQGYPISQSYLPQSQFGAWSPVSSGLSHTGLVPRPDIAIGRIDPMTAWWISQQFPYAFSPVAPVL